MVKSGLHWPLLRAVAHIPENAPAGKQVFLARAEDVDEENSSNSAIVYELTVNPRDLFSIAPSTGMISLKRPLRHELESGLGSTISLEVRATDQGSPPLSSRQLVTLLVDDVNDHTPVFEYSTYETSLLETVSGECRLSLQLQLSIHPFLTFQFLKIIIFL